MLSKFYYSKKSTSAEYRFQVMRYSKNLDWEYWVNKSDAQTPAASTATESSDDKSERADESALFNNLLSTISATNKRSSNVQAGGQKASLIRPKRQNPLLNLTHSAQNLSIEEYIDNITQMTGGDRDKVEKDTVNKEFNIEDVDSELKAKIERETEEFYKNLTPEQFDKLFYDAQAENLLLKELERKMLNTKSATNNDKREIALLLSKLEPDALSMTSNSDFRELISSLLDGTLSLENLAQVVREARSAYARKTAAQRKKEALATSYKFYLQQRDLNFEKMRGEKAFGEMVHKFHALRQYSPQAYQQQIQELSSKTLPSGVIGKILDRLVAGDSIPEVKRYFDSLTYEQLRKPEYEIDPHAEYREQIQKTIDDVQEQMLIEHGVKTGRRGPTPVKFIAPGDEYLLQEMTKNSVGDPMGAHLDIGMAFKHMLFLHELEGIDMKMKMSYKHGRTYIAPRALDKRQKRTEKRRANIVRLENTVRAFMWIRKYKPKFFA